jgi:hypothetical protein
VSALGVVERGRSGPSGGVSGKKKELLRLVFEVLITKSHTVLCDLGDLGALDISCFDFLQDHQDLRFFSRYCKSIVSSPSNTTSKHEFSQDDQEHEVSSTTVRSQNAISCV